MQPSTGLIRDEVSGNGPAATSRHGFGRDPVIRKLAEEIVTTQEIAVMRDWLKQRGQ